MAPDTKENRAGARRYATNELLELRTALPFVTFAIENLNSQPDLGCVLRIPEAAHKDPEHFSCKSSMLVELRHRIEGPQINRRRTIESSRESEYQSTPNALAKPEPGQLHHWVLRRRDSSDRSSQPHSAPTDIRVQRSENFQKFYRAVVSPTHVRVTAGGRIVPNTRATAPPLLEWNTDDPTSDSIKQDPPELDNSRFVPFLTPELGTCEPLLSPNFAPQYNLLPGDNQSSLPTMAVGPHPRHVVHDAERGTVNQGASSSTPTDTGGHPAQPGLIKLSPPTQFDQSRPFMFNGQWVIPLGMSHGGGVPIPVPMLGHPGFFPSPPMASPGFMAPQFPMPIPGHPPQMVFPPGFPMMGAGAGQLPEGLPAMPQYLPMPGMVLNVDAVKAQASSMRLQLKNIDDLLAINKGQGDAFMDHQRAFLVTQINAMEAIIENQRANEAKASTEKIPLEMSKQHATGAAAANEPGTQPPAVVSSSMAVAKRHSGPSKDVPKKQPEPCIKSRLTSAAALAPPFQPRSQTAIRKSNKVSGAFDDEMPNLIAFLTANPHVQAADEAKLRAIAMSSWDSPDEPYVTLGPAHTFEGPHVKKSAQPFKMQHPGALPGSSKVDQEEKFSMPAGSVPYLIGVPPYGANAISDNGNNFMYSRPLTAEEVRARYLYWGKAPRSVQSGLPKFDGKDFYPPSPVKGKASLAADNVPARATTPANPEAPKFGMLYNSGYKTSPSGMTHNDSWIGVGSVLTQPVFQHGPQISQPKGSSYNARVTYPSTGGLGIDYDAEALYHAAPTPTTGGEDYSDLFLESGMSGYKSQPPKTKETSGEKRGKAPAQSFTSVSTSSSVEFNLGQQNTPVSPEQTYEQRVENFRKPEQQSLFLQNILKKEATMVGSALSGTISSATAQGYLPPYRGSAAASLNPAAMNLQHRGSDGEGVGLKANKQFSGHSSTMASSYLPENRPFNAGRFLRAVPPTTSAEGYMGFTATKEEEDKTVTEAGWNPNTTSRGPITGSDW